MDLLEKLGVFIGEVEKEFGQNRSKRDVQNALLEARKHLIEAAQLIQGAAIREHLEK